MNYFLILGVIVSIVFFAALFVNNVSKVVQQSEARDVAFTMIGVILAFSILVVFIISSVRLKEIYNEHVQTTTETIIVPGRTGTFIHTSNDFTIFSVEIDGILRGVTIDKSLKVEDNPLLSGNIQVEVTSYEAPYTWYMFDWYVDSLNNTRTYTLKTIYN